MAFSLGQCTTNANCELFDANKQCTSGSCVCKSGFYSDRAGTCITGKD